MNDADALVMVITMHDKFDSVAYMLLSFFKPHGAEYVLGNTVYCRYIMVSVGTMIIWVPWFIYGRAIYT